MEALENAVERFRQKQRQEAARQERDKKRKEKEAANRAKRRDLLGISLEPRAKTFDEEIANIDLLNHGGRTWGERYWSHLIDSPPRKPQRPLIDQHVPATPPIPVFKVLVPQPATKPAKLNTSHESNSIGDLLMLNPTPSRTPSLSKFETPVSHPIVTPINIIPSVELGSSVSAKGNTYPIDAYLTAQSTNPCHCYSLDCSCAFSSEHVDETITANKYTDTPFSSALSTTSRPRPQVVPDPDSDSAVKPKYIHYFVH